MRAFTVLCMLVVLCALGNGVGAVTFDTVSQHGSVNVSHVESVTSVPVAFPYALMFVSLVNATGCPNGTAVDLDVGLPDGSLEHVHVACESEVMWNTSVVPCAAPELQQQGASVNVTWQLQQGPVASLDLSWVISFRETLMDPFVEYRVSTGTPWAPASVQLFTFVQSHMSEDMPFTYETKFRQSMFGDSGDTAPSASLAAHALPLSTPCITVPAVYNNASVFYYRATPQLTGPRVAMVTWRSNGGPAVLHNVTISAAPESTQLTTVVRRGTQKLTQTPFHQVEPMPFSFPSVFVSAMQFSNCVPVNASGTITVEFLQGRVQAPFTCSQGISFQLGPTDACDHPSLQVPGSVNVTWTLTGELQSVDLDWGVAFRHTVIEPNKFYSIDRANFDVAPGMAGSFNVLSPAVGYSQRVKYDVEVYQVPQVLVPFYGTLRASVAHPVPSTTCSSLTSVQNGSHIFTNTWVPDVQGPQAALFAYQSGAGIDSLQVIRVAASVYNCTHCAPTAAPTVAPTGSTPSAPPTTPSPTSSSHKSGLTTGQIVGIAIGCGAGAVIIGVLVALAWRKHRASSGYVQI